MSKKKAVWCAAILGLILGGAIWAHEGKPHYMGEVTAIDADHIELKLQDGKTFSAKLDRNTKVFSGDAAATLADVKVGARAVIHLAGEGKSLGVREIHLGTTKSAEHHGAGGHMLAISVTEDGFVPRDVKVKKGEPINLVVTRKTDRTCAKEIKIAEYGVARELPLNTPVTIALTPKKSGEIKFTCGMGMYDGVVTVE